MSGKCRHLHAENERLKLELADTKRDLQNVSITEICGLQEKYNTGHNTHYTYGQFVELLESERKAKATQRITRQEGEHLKDLNKLYYIKREIEDLKEEIKSIPEISSIDISGMPHSNTVSDPIYNLIQKKEKLIERLNKKIEQYLDELIRIENIIDQIDDIEIRSMARMRFIKNMKWEDIGEQVHLNRSVCSKKVRKYLDAKVFDKQKIR